MAINACLQGVIDGAKSIIPEQDLKDFIKQVKDRASKVKVPSQLQDIISEYHERIDAIAENEDYNKKLNAIKFKDIQRLTSGTANPAAKLHEFLRSGRESVGNRQLTHASTFMGNLDASLTRAELTTLQDGAADVQIAEAARNDSSDNPVFHSIAKKVDAVFDDIRKRLNMDGAMIGKREGWLFRQSHNPEMLKKIDVNPAAEVSRIQRFFDKFKRAMSPQERNELSFQRWKNFTVSRIDREASNLKNYSDNEFNEWLRNFYDNVNSGVHTSLAESAPGVFRGSSIVSRLSAERKMIFKTAKDEIEYAKEYGYGNLYQNIYRNIEIYSKNLGLLETMGSNPENMFNKVLQDHIGKQKQNPDMIKKLQGRWLQSAWETVSGHYKMSYDNGLARAGANIRGYYAATKFGGSSITAALLDPLGRAAYLKNYKGVSWVKAMWQGYSEGAKYLSEDREKIINYTHAFSRQTLGGMQARMGLDTLPAKIVSKLQDLTFRLNGLHFLDRMRTEGVVMAEGSDMARNLSTEFSKLPDAVRQNYERYGINESEWKALKGAQMKVSNKGNFLFADSVAKMSNESLQAHADETAQTVYKARNELQLKIANYLRDAAGFIVMDARDPTLRSIYNYFGGPGTFGGELIRTALLGKAWSIQYTYRVINPLLMQGTWGNRLKNAVVLSLYSTMMGYFAGQARSLLSGKLVSNPADPNTILKAAKDGGALGLYSDIPLRYIPDPGNSLMGPAIGDIYKGLKVPYDAASGKDKQARSELSQWFMGNLPMVNLPYAKLVLDHAILYGAQNMIAPGSVQKMQYNAEKSGANFWWAPTKNSLGV